MTKKDLELIYKGETGEYPPDKNSEDLEKLREWILWLEDKLVNLYNV